VSVSDDVRYGVFLVPDARTSAAVTDITTYLRAQFGFVSAGRFPPHVTLAGSLPIAVGEPDLLTAVREVADRHAPIRLTNHGVHRLGDALVFDVHRSNAGHPNQPLLDLVTDISAAVRPLLRLTDGQPADIRDRQSWRGHLSLASHELAEGDDDLRDEVREFIDQLAVPHPTSSRSVRLAVYRLHHPDWFTGWWASFWWEHIQSFLLVSARPR
jgi:hypothetical protein